MSDQQPFDSAAGLAAWAAEVLRARGIDAIYDWPMLECWARVELFRAARVGEAAPWKPSGGYEPPYVTRIPRARPETSRTDLLFAKDLDRAPERVLWLELRDLGRDPGTVNTHAANLGEDLAVLWGIDKAATLKQWLHPPVSAVGLAKAEEWKRTAGETANAQWGFGQVVIVAKRRFESVPERHIAGLWLKAYEHRVETTTGICPERPVVEWAETKEFLVSALIEALP